MDWAVTARTNVPHVREVDADRELTTWVLVDGSASMDFGTAEVEKRELAVAAVAAVGFLTAGAGNRLGAHVLRRRDPPRFPARTGRTHCSACCSALLDAPRRAARRPGRRSPAAIAGLARAALRRRAGRGGLRLPRRRATGPASCAGWPPGTRCSRSRSLDPRELELPDVGLITLVDPETGRRREVSTGEPPAARAATPRPRPSRAGGRRGPRCAGAGAAHLPLRTDRDWVADIVRHVLRRSAGSRPPHRDRGGRT